MKNPITTLAVIIFSLISSHVNAKASPTTPSFQELMNMRFVEGEYSLSNANEDKNLRVKAMRESAMVLGIHSGFNFELNRLQNALISIEGELDKIYDFGILMRSTNSGRFEAFLLPGIVEETKERMQVSDDGKRLSFVQESFELLREERFVIDQPNWRNYLLLNPFKEYQRPFNQILPKDEFESAIWKKAVKKGWEIGVKQANQELIANARNLRRDYVGMTKYIRLSLEGKIDTASLAFTQTMAESDGSTLDINKFNYQISSPARLNADNGKWEIITTDNRDSYRKVN